MACIFLSVPAAFLASIIQSNGALATRLVDHLLCPHHPQCLVLLIIQPDQPLPFQLKDQEVIVKTRFLHVSLSAYDRRLGRLHLLPHSIDACKKNVEVAL